MAESDRPTPEAQPDETQPNASARDEPAMGEVFLEDGTRVGEDSQGASSEEVDELLTLFEEELASPATDEDAGGVRMTDQEAAEEDLLRQAEALLGTTDPQELQELSQVHRAEAAEHYERLKTQVPAAETEIAPQVVESAPEAPPPVEAPVEAAEPPTPAESPEPETAAAEPETDEAELEAAIAESAEPGAPAVEEPALEPVAARVSDAPPQAVADAAPVVQVAASAAPDVAAPIAAADPTKPSAEPAVAVRPRGAAGAGIVQRLGGGMLRRVAALGLGVLGLFRLRPVLEWIGSALRPTWERAAGSKGRLAVGAGSLAAVAAYCGFALFDARFSAQVLQRRFPDAATPVDLQYMQAVAEIEHGEFARAKQRLRRIPSDTDGARTADVLFALGEASYLDSAAPVNLRATQARGFYLEAIAIDPAHPHVPHARRRIAECYRAQGLLPEAEQAYRLLLERYRTGTDVAAAQFALGDVLLQDDRPVPAAEAFERVWNEHADSPLASAAQLRQGDALAAAGSPDPAQQLWIRLTEATTPADVRWQAVARLADLVESRGDTRAAMAWLDAWLRGAQDSTGHAAMLLRYAALARQVGDVDASNTALDQVLVAYPDDPAALDAGVLRGAAHRAAGDTEAARTVYARRLERAPDHPQLLTAMRETYAAEGNTDRALEYARRAAKAWPRSAEAQLALARAYRAAEQPALAMKVYWSMLGRYPLASETQTAVNALVPMLQERGLTTEAYKAINLYGSQAVDNEGVAAAQQAKATLLASLELWDDAAVSLTLAVDAAPTVERRLQLAAVQSRLRDWPGVLESVAGLRSASLTDVQHGRVARLETDALVHADRAREALVILAVAEDRLMPMPLRLRGLRAEALMGLNETAQARELMAAFDSEFPADVAPPEALAPTYLAWSQHLFDQRIYTGAAASYARVTGEGYTRHDRAWAAYQLGNCFTHLQEYDQAASAYERMIREHPQAPWVPFAREKAQFAQLQADAARRASRT